MSYGFLPCTTTAWGNLFLVLAYGFLMFKSATYLYHCQKMLLQILGPGIVLRERRHSLHTPGQSHRCEMKFVLLEMDRILRPTGYAIIRENAYFLDSVARRPLPPHPRRPPHALLILVSGLSGTKEVAQSQVLIGMGLLAGSTICRTSFLPEQEICF
uniref:Putative methyltransferase n=1 Tax=Oryza sativa subsp. indica TaxID=39946 RepID=D3XB19_ORYSI|nr:putative methyltransferase [Oryza sativa Indica Group]